MRFLAPFLSCVETSGLWIAGKLRWAGRPVSGRFSAKLLVVATLLVVAEVAVVDVEVTLAVCEWFGIPVRSEAVALASPRRGREWSPVRDVAGARATTTSTGAVVRQHCEADGESARVPVRSADPPRCLQRRGFLGLLRIQPARPRHCHERHPQRLLAQRRLRPERAPNSCSLREMIGPGGSRQGFGREACTLLT